MIHQLIYVSQARRPFGAEALAALLGHSRRANAAAGVTGLLIYREDPASYARRTRYDTQPNTPGLAFGPYRIVEARAGSEVLLER